MNYNTKRGVTQVSILEELAKLDSVCITPEQAAPAIGCNSQWIRKMAEDEKKRNAIGFPVIRIGCRTKIPRIPFLKALGWEVEA